MRTFRAALTILALIAAPTTQAAAQEQSPGLLAKTLQLEVEPDRFPQFEEALRQHLAFHRTNQDDWSWHTWQVVNGERLGQYYLRTHGHQWEDFDVRGDMRRSDWADFLTNVAPHLESMSSSITSLEPGLSNWPPDLRRPVMVSLTRFELTYDSIRRFRDALQKVHAAMSDKASDRHYAWATTINGSDGPEMTLMVPLNAWADLEPRQPSLWRVVEDVYGPEQSSALRKEVAASVRAIHTSVVAYREDLSYDAEGP